MKRGIALGGFYLAVVSGALWILARTTHARAPEVVGLFVFFAVFLGLGILSARPERADRTLVAAIRAYLLVLLRLALAIAPVMTCHWFATRVVEGLPGFLQAIFLLFWGCCLAAGLAVIGRAGSREAFFTRLQTFGPLAPLLFSFNILVISILFFATASHLLVDRELLEFIPKGERLPSNAALADFYLWHFMKSIPLLDVNETLRWEAPFDYETPAIGWILLLFKAAVIVPVVSAFRGYWKHRKERATDGGAAAEG